MEVGLLPVYEVVGTAVVGKYPGAAVGLSARGLYVGTSVVTPVVGRGVEYVGMGVATIGGGVGVGGPAERPLHSVCSVDGTAGGKPCDTEPAQVLHATAAILAVVAAVADNKMPSKAAPLSAT